jgi:hypothetical protein
VRGDESTRGAWVVAVNHILPYQVRWCPVPSSDGPVHVLAAAVNAPGEQEACSFELSTGQTYRGRLARGWLWPYEIVDAAGSRMVECRRRIGGWPPGVWEVSRRDGGELYRRRAHRNARRVHLVVRGLLYWFWNCWPFEIDLPSLGLSVRQFRDQWTGTSRESRNVPILLSLMYAQWRDRHLKSAELRW